MANEPPYDITSRESIIHYAKFLVGHTLREKVHIEQIDDPKVRRGSFGNAIEEYYFKYDINSNQEPDFSEAGLELKTTPMKRNPKGSLVAKERLVITMIDYNKVVKESFETSHFMKKASSILLIVYLWEENLNPIDYEVLFAEEWDPSEEDRAQFKADWEKIVNKVRAGHAEDISGSDTLYLEACTKAANSSVRRSQPYSDVPAKPRAWAIKASYMTVIENKLLSGSQKIERSEDERELDLLSLLRKRFQPFFGMTLGQLCERFGVAVSGRRLPKNAAALVTRRILGVDDDADIEEFVKAGAKTKTIRLKRTGRPKEAVSFPAFDYFKLESTPFEQSDFYGNLQQLWLFVIYREDEWGFYRLSDLCFWQMPERDIPEAKRCYDQMRRNVELGRADVSVKSSENRCCHVRPHGRDSADVLPQPHGMPVTKKCFWLNQSYLQDEIERILKENDSKM